MNDSMISIWDELFWRGLIENSTNEKALQQSLTKPIVLYCGFDPTADSLHVGNLIPLIALRRFQLFGHKIIALAGGATGSIGDPSGRSTERPLLVKDALSINISKIKMQLKRLLDFDDMKNPARLLDNSEWTDAMSYLDFLRNVGRHFSVNMMLAKESVRARMGGQGLSYTEFSYMLLQSFDFYHMCKKMDCRLQIGGSDQWGNITAGIDFVRKKLGQITYGITLPLITNSDGSKFGKTASGTIWLDESKTSVYRFYQFWIRSDDRDVIRYLKFFTFMPKGEIDALLNEHMKAPEKRLAQRKLAQKMTEMIHGIDASSEAERSSQILFGGDLAGITEASFCDIMTEIPSVVLSRSQLKRSFTIVDLAVEATICSSKGQARRDIQGGGINLNNVRQSDINKQITCDDLLFDRFILLRKGKKNYMIVSFES